MIDLGVAPKYGVEFLTYWFDAGAGAAFCLARAASAADLAAVHREGHGLVPNAIIAVDEDNVLKFLGTIEEPADQTGLTSPFRTILFNRGDDLFGSTVNLASRICDAAEGGQILVSDVVQDLGRPLGFTFLEPACGS